MANYVYRVTRTSTRKIGRASWTQRKVTPLATRQRLGCIRAWTESENAILRETGRDDECWTMTVERAEIGEWETKA